MSHPLAHFDPASLVPIQTGDGSYTFYDARGNIYFRSLQGARSESEYVFLEGTRLRSRSPDWRVLELGLGLGMNFLVTAQAFLKSRLPGRLIYHGVEQAPLPAERLQQLHYEQWLEFPALLACLQGALRQAQTGQQASMSWQSVELVLYPSPWSALCLPKHLQFDAIYHDPFGPGANPEGWSMACFAWEAAHLDAGGVLATYGAATAVRRAMAAAGLWLATRKGSGNKREMTLAAWRPEALAGYQLLSRDKYLI